MNLLQEPRRGYAFLTEGGEIDELAKALSAGMIWHMPGPMSVSKIKGAVKAFSFHWSNAQQAWDVIVWKDFPGHLDGAEFILFLSKTALSPLGKPWSLTEMQYVAKKLAHHPGFASSMESGQRRALDRVTARWLRAATPTVWDG